MLPTQFFLNVLCKNVLLNYIKVYCLAFLFALCIFSFFLHQRLMKKLAGLTVCGIMCCADISG